MTAAADGHQDEGPDHPETEEETLTNWISKVNLLSQISGLQVRLPCQSIRILELDNNELTSACLPAISALLTENMALHTLSLSGNKIGSDVPAFIKLAEALGRSPLRCLSFSSNPITPDSLTAFFDSIPANGTALECLQLSNVLNDEANGLQTTEEGALIVAKAVAGFIADPRRFRGISTLFLNGNGFGSRGVRAIVSALVGSEPVPGIPSKSSEEARKHSSIVDLQKGPLYDAVSRAKIRRPNRSLDSLALFGNIERGWLPGSTQKDAERLASIRKRYASIPASEIEPIVAFLDLRARRKRLQGSSFAESELPIEVSRHLLTIDASLDEWEDDFQEAAEIGAGLHSKNWKNLMRGRLSRNEVDAASCRRSAARVLAAARVLGCKARRATPQTSSGEVLEGFHKFLDLPPELRLSVLSNLDEDSILSARQFSHVLSFACDPTTIGYGELGFCWNRILDRCASADISTSSTLPAQRWSWEECFALRAPPREWAAEILDASDEHLSRSRTIHLEPNDLPNKDADPGFYAFLESTMTHRAEE